MNKKFVVVTLTGILILDNEDAAYETCNDVVDTTPAYMWTTQWWMQCRHWTRRINVWSKGYRGDY